MEFRCSKKDLLKSIQIVETAVSTKVTLPILSNFLFDVEQNRIKLVSTDLEVAVKCYLDGEVKETEGITIPAKRFGNIIREIPDEEIEIKTDQNYQVNINADKSHFTLTGTSKEDFPILPDFIEEKAILIETKLLREMIKKTIFCVSTDETRYVLTGVYLVIESDSIKLVSTDGRRLCYINRKTSDNKNSANVIIPAKCINELQRILSIEDDEKTKISITENQAAFKIKDITLISRLIEGKFPNYQQVIPKKHQYSIKVNSKNLLSSAKQISLLTAEKSGVVKFSFGKKVLRASAQIQGVGSGLVDMDINYTGPNLEIAFNPAYIIDILKNITEEEVEFQINSPVDACVIKPVGDDDYIYVVMPMKI